MEQLLRKIPKIDLLMKHSEFGKMAEIYGKEPLKEALREVVNEIREKIKNGEPVVIPEVEEIIKETEMRIRERTTPTLRKVINATGIIIHTNLGRSILSKKAIQSVIMASSGYTNLEYDLKEGKRGERYVHCSEILRKLTEAEDALIVNNNAAAVYLVLNTLAYEKEVIVSRGELVEIGGSFRIPDVMKKSGAIIKEVGTTNRTYLKDYEEAITEKTGLIMKVHTSNFVIKGFTHDVKTDELLLLSRKYGLPFYYDAGSGLLFSSDILGERNEPHVKSESKKGIDLISFSGDKLLGGPQAGIIVGKKEYIQPMKKNPLLRALRPDKLTLSALEATLLSYLDEEKAKSEIPTLKMLTCEISYLKKRTLKLIRNVKKRCPDVDIVPQSLFSEVGGGSLPDAKIPSFGFSFRPRKLSVSRFEELLRNLPVPIIARIEKERILFDMRTVPEEDEEMLISELVNTIKKSDLDG
jgi:L-seryl-tRNA(Ser) seleniumtransferase